LAAGGLVARDRAQGGQWRRAAGARAWWPAMIGCGAVIGGDRPGSGLVAGGDRVRGGQWRRSAGGRGSGLVAGGDRAWGGHWRRSAGDRGSGLVAGGLVARNGTRFREQRAMVPSAPILSASLSAFPSASLFDPEAP